MKSFLLYFCLLTVFSSFVFADTAKFSVDFVLIDEDLYPNGEIPGKVYYLYNTESVSDSKVRYEYNLFVGGQQKTFVELEDFKSGKIFKICDKTCESYPLSRTPQQWWYKDGDVETIETDSDGFTRYTRAVTDYGITELWLKNRNVPSAPFNVKGISFSTGRILTFETSTFSTNVNDGKFDPNTGGVTCSVTKCNTYMDLIFVFDSSGSVGSSNWEIMKEFAKNVTRQTDVSAESAAIAVVGFGGDMTRSCDCLGGLTEYNVDIDGPNRWFRWNEYDTLTATYDVYSNGRKKSSCTLKKGADGKFTYTANSGEVRYCENVLKYKKGYESYSGYSISNDHTTVKVGTQTYNTELPYDRCFGNFTNCTGGSSRFKSKIYVDLTYSGVDDVVNQIQQKVTYNSNSGTCQALGLIKAMDILNRGDRTASNGGIAPQRVVIVLTDGDDHCSEMTRHYAEVMRTEYQATLIEVGIDLETYYDKQLLENMSTHFGGLPSYFDVASFDDLQNLLDKMVSDVCRTDYAEAAGSCNVRCKGFCGCGGSCICPTCRPELSNQCHNFTCEIYSNVGGCFDEPRYCSDEFSCTEDICINETGCVYQDISCRDGLKTCQVSTCQENLGGMCSSVTNDDSECPQYPYPCYDAVCDPSNPASDSVSGCRYEYRCVGEHPVEFDQNGGYLRGCYRYSCDNATRTCGTSDVCKEMSDENMCTEFKCIDGSCQPDKPKKTCPETNGCLIQSVCNPQTGECDSISITANECKKRIKEEAAYHVGPEDWQWFATQEELEAFYSCGEFECDANRETSAGITKITMGSCIFTPGDDETCSACGGLYPNQPTFESCEAEAKQKHQASEHICFTSSCVKSGESSSECTFKNKTCEFVGCKNVICNETTNECQYEWTSEYLELKKQENKCAKVQCINGEPRLISIYEELCLGENNEKVPVCKKYDRCDPNIGCIYKDKCVKEKNCTTMSCDMNTNKCVEEKVTCEASNNMCFETKCLESTDSCEAYLLPALDLCGAGDKCNMMVCDPIVNACKSVPIQFPNETDKCHNYTCDPETGEWTVVEKCDDDDICTVDSCVPFDGSCSNFKRDCHELNMTGFGSCFGRACSKSRKNGCFRKVYENSYFDECGNCLRGYSAGDSGTTESEESDCKKALSFQEEAAVISAGILAAIIIACVIGAIAVSTAGTLATKELIKRARSVNNSGAHDNPLFEEDGQEMENPTFVGND